MNSGSRPSVENRFWSKVNKNGLLHPVLKTQCWEWVGCLHRNGYGKIKIPKTRSTEGVHRYSWVIHYGKIPNKMHVLHKCDNPKCVRPDHLRLGTNIDNRKDSVSKDRHSRGERCNLSKLTEKEVLLVRKMYVSGTKKFGLEALAKQFNVSHATISRAINRKTWKHI